jgi:hypothetical protein
VALALGHHAAWLRFQASGLPLALFVVEPESLQVGGGGSGGVHASTFSHEATARQL